MTSEGLGELFKGDLADTFSEKFLVDGGMNDPVKHSQMGSEDPHQHKRNLSSFFLSFFSKLVFTIQSLNTSQGHNLCPLVHALTSFPLSSMEVYENLNAREEQKYKESAAVKHSD